MKYLDHIKSKEPHEQRRHALNVAGIIVGIFALAWIGTLPMRLGALSQASAPNPTTDYTQTAAVAGASDTSQPGVEVASTSVYSLPDYSQ